MRLARTILLLALAAAPGSARAGDGVIEINQSCALAGCFAGDAAGFPVTIEASGSYRLTSNLVSGSTGIQIITDAVQLDLGGFMVDGGGRCTGTPVASCSGSVSLTIGIIVTGDQVRILDGVVRGFALTGIRFTSCTTGCVLEHVMVTETASDGVTVLSTGTADLTLRDVDLLRNGDEGFDVIGGVGHLTIDQSRVVGNTGAGAEGMTKSTLTRTRFSSNGAPGVSCSECAMGDCQFWDNAGSDVVAQFTIGALRDMGGNVCDDGTCP